MNKEVMGVQEVSPGYEFVAENLAVPLGYKKTEVGVIPEDWGTSIVGDEFTIQLGKMLDSERNTGEPKPYLGNRSVQWGRIDITDLATVPMTKADLNKYRLDEGDILVCEGGEVGRAAIWNAQINECYFQKALHRLKPIGEYNTKLMVAILRRWADKGILKHYVTQTSIAHLPRDKFLTIPIPVPPIEEQRAIATALSDVDALLEEVDRLIAKKRDIKQATMQQLLTGETRLPGFEGEWKRVLLGDVAAFYKGKGLPKSAINTFGEQPCIHYGELFTQYGVQIEKTISRTDEHFDSFLSVANDVLMPTSDVTPSGLAKASCVSTDNVVLGGDILVIRTAPDRVNGVFLSSIIRKDADQVLRLVTGTTVYHLYGSDMKKFVFAIPPIAEQNAIVDTLADMDTEIQALEQRRSKTAELKQGMMQELLTGRTRLV